MNDTTRQMNNAMHYLRLGIAEAEKEFVRMLSEADKRNGDLAKANYDLKQTIRRMQSTTKPLRRPHHIPIHNSMKCRTVGPAERVFLKRWRQENRRQRGINGGNGLLELLMSEFPNEMPAAITNRDAMVAATVIQWLGTSCGSGFLSECERDIVQARKILCPQCYRCYKDLPKHIKSKHANIAEDLLRMVHD